MVHVASRLARAPRALLAAVLVAACIAEGAQALAEPREAHDDALAKAVDRPTLIREALDRNPGLKAAAERARSMRSMARAEGRLPDPEVMFQTWQVPFAHPVSLGDSQMIMAGVSQTFPAPGSLSAAADARDHAATGEEAMLADRARDLVRDVQYAYADLTEAVARHRAHVDHRGVAARLLAAAQARQVAGGSLDDVAQAQLDLARIDADVATEVSSIARAKARLNGFLTRHFDAPLADPDPGEVASVTMSEDDLLQLAEQTRPDLRAADARIEADRSSLQSADRAAALPSFTVGAYYFAPTTLMPFNGYGVSASMTLPWVWGGNARKEDAQRALAQASRFDAADARLRIGVDVGTAAASVHAAVERFRSLRDGALPAARRALDVTFATYAAGRGDLLGLLRAQQAVVDTDIDIVAARASLDHALADLDWAVGTVLPRTPLEARPSAGH